MARVLGQLSHGRNICFFGRFTSSQAVLPSQRFAVSNHTSPMARVLGQLSHGRNICFFGRFTSSQAVLPSQRFAVSNHTSPMARVLGQLSHGRNICFFGRFTSSQAVLPSQRAWCDRTGRRLVLFLECSRHQQGCEDPGRGWLDHN